MRVRVKDGETGFYGEKRRREGEVFDLVPRQLSNGDLYTIAEQMKGCTWLEEVPDTTEHFNPSYDPKAQAEAATMSANAKALELQITDAARVAAQTAAEEVAKSTAKTEMDATVAAAVAAALSAHGIKPVTETPEQGAPVTGYTPRAPVLTPAPTPVPPAEPAAPVAEAGTSVPGPTPQAPEEPAAGNGVGSEGGDAPAGTEGEGGSTGDQDQL